MAEYPNYETISSVVAPDGQATGVASIGGKGAWSLGGQVNTLTSAGAVRNILDDGSGNETIAGTLTVTGTIVSNATPTVTTPTLSSGTAVQNTSGGTETFYIALTGGTSGTYSIAIGAANTTTHALATTLPLASDGVLVTVRVPPTWWIKVTVVSAATITATTVVTG